MVHLCTTELKEQMELKPGQFLKMNIEQRVMYVNALLRSGESLTSIANKIPIARSSLQAPFKVAGYIFNRKTKQYVFNDEVMTNPLTTTEIKERLIIIEELIRRYLASEDSIPYKALNELIADVPSGKEIRVTIRINEKIWTAFDEYSNKHTNFYKKDLLGLALLEFMGMYKDKDICL